MTQVGQESLSFARDQRWASARADANCAALVGVGPAPDMSCPSPSLLTGLVEIVGRASAANILGVTMRELELDTIAPDQSEKGTLAGDITELNPALKRHSWTPLLEDQG